MNKNRITVLEFSTLSFFLLNSFLMNVGYYIITSTSKTDAILDILIGGVIIAVFSLLINKIIKKYPSKDIIEKIKILFPKLKFIIIPIILIILVINTIYSIEKISNFINYYILKEVSLFIITLTIIMLVLYIVKKGLPTIAKTSEIFFYIYLMITIIGMVGLTKYIDLSNIKPLLTTNVKSHISSSFIYALSSIIPFFLLLIIPSKQIENKKKKEKYLLIFSAISTILIFINLFLIISILGINLTNIYQHPDMIIYKRISFLNVLERLEVTLALNNILNSLFLILMSIYFISTMIKHTIKKQKEHITLIVLGIFFLITSTIIKLNLNIYLLLNILTLIIIFIISTKLLITYINTH